MANLASLVPQSVSIPRPDNSWLDGIADSLGGLATELGARKSFGALADRIGGGSPAAAPQGGFLSRLTGGAQTQPRASGGRSMAIADVNPSIRDGIIQTASSLGVDPVDLATAISYETGGTFDPTKSGPTTQWGTHRGLIQFGEPQAQKYGVNWDDPIGSQLGENGAVAAYLRDTGVKPGANLLDIYSAINAGGVGRYNASDANNGGAPGTVRDKVEQQMGGHRQRALALLKDVGTPYTPSLAQPQGTDPALMARVENGPATAADAVSAMADGSLASGFNGAPAVAPAQQAIAQAAPVQQGIIAPGITPVQRGGVDTETIKFMLRDPNLRQAGLKLWAANVEGQNPSEPWQFVNLPDGTLARANQQTGQVERLGNFAKPNEDATVVGDNLVRRSTGEVIYEGKPKTPASFQEYQLAKENGFTGSYADWEKVKVPGTSVNVNTGEGDKFYEKLDQKNAENFATIGEQGLTARANIGQVDRLESLMANTPQGAEGAIKQWLGDIGVNTEGLDNIQATRALIEKMVPEQRAPGSGTMSDGDIAMFRNSLPRVINQPGGNALIIQTLRAINDYQMKQGEIADAVSDRTITPAEGRKRLRELANPLSGYRDAIKGFQPAPSSSGGKAPTVAPEGVDPAVWNAMTPEEKALWRD